LRAHRHGIERRRQLGGIDVTGCANCQRINGHTRPLLTPGRTPLTWGATVTNPRPQAPLPAHQPWPSTAPQRRATCDWWREQNACHPAPTSLVLFVWLRLQFYTQATQD